MISSTWQRAVERSTSLLSREEQVKYENSCPEDIVQDFRNHHLVRGKIDNFLKRVQPLVTAIERYGEPLNVIVNASPTILSPTWGILRALLIIAREYEDYFSKLMKMLQQIGDALPRFQVYEELFRNHESFQRTLCAMYSELISFLCSAKKVFSNSSFRRKVLWRSFDDTFCDHITAFIRYSNLVEREANLADMVECSQARVQLDAQMKYLIEARQNREQGFVVLKSWLDARQCHEERDGIEILPGTCEWILDRKELLAWIHKDDSQLFWVYGPPGCGKSFLYAKILQYIDAALAMPYVYFLFCGADGERVTVASLLRSWTFQLAKICDEAKEHIILSRNGSENHEATDKEVYEIFLSLLEVVPPCFLTVDAVDECLDRPTFYKLLSLIPKHFKVLITSRHLPELSEHLQLQQLQQHIELEVLPEMTYSDIEFYIASHLNNITLRYCPEIVAAIKDKLKHSNGIFLWVRLMFRYIQDQTCNEEIMQCLNELPMGLSERYDRILRDINGLAKTKPRERLLAHKVFFWVSVARRPLRIKEVCGFLAVKPSSDRKNGFVEWRMANDPESSIMSICGSLLVARGSGQTLYPIHFTASEYLKQYMSNSERLAEITAYYDVQQLNSNDSLAAAVCMRYLSLEFIEYLHSQTSLDHSDTGNMLNSDEAKMVILRYATRQWFNHLKNVQSAELLLLSIAREFLDDSRRNLDVFWHLYWSSKPETAENGRVPAPSSRAHIIAYFGLHSVLQLKVHRHRRLLVVLPLGILLRLFSVLMESLKMYYVNIPWSRFFLVIKEVWKTCCSS
ncbi:uncharacterized protein LY89DRAFT_733531 [Mollisia scopiformis]|uniref:Uncharacterized protein n=1 Tax=Mollisia scopiformis TaxID=149040 RepID=A0A194XC08_MOLSC|nr:uncharacterized protein LY89DRAFT_733531 [Mollisia scopiformis]KUJ17699.1 hypothetical protein LY89DRAFT_733531 [Mollisia scopiformis]